MSYLNRACEPTSKSTGGHTRGRCLAQADIVIIITMHEYILRFDKFFGLPRIIRLTTLAIWIVDEHNLIWKLTLTRKVADETLFYI